MIMDKIPVFNTEQETLLKASEVAKALNISRAFAYKLMRRGKIRTVVMEGARRVRPQDLKHYIESCLTPSLDEFMIEE